MLGGQAPGQTAAHDTLTRRPLWNPAATGYHLDGLLTIRLPVGGGEQRTIQLREHEAALWCASTGEHTEADLAGILAADYRLDPVAAAQTVERFVNRLLRDGALVDRSHGQVLDGACEFEEIPWARPTS